jgi:hypothetical protein
MVAAEVYAIGEEPIFGAVAWVEAVEHGREFAPDFNNLRCRQ